MEPCCHPFSLAASKFQGNQLGCDSGGLQLVSIEGSCWKSAQLWMHPEPSRLLDGACGCIRPQIWTMAVPYHQSQRLVKWSDGQQESPNWLIIELRAAVCPRASAAASQRGDRIRSSKGPTGRPLPKAPQSPRQQEMSHNPQSGCHQS